MSESEKPTNTGAPATDNALPADAAPATGAAESAASPHKSSAAAAPTDASPATAAPAGEKKDSIPAKPDGSTAPVEHKKSSLSVNPAAPSAPVEHKKSSFSVNPTAEQKKSSVSVNPAVEPKKSSLTTSAPVEAKKSSLTGNADASAPAAEEKKDGALPGTDARPTAPVPDGATQPAEAGKSEIPGGPENIAAAEPDPSQLPDQEESVELLFGDMKKSSKASLPAGAAAENLKPPDETTDDVLSSVDYSVQTAACIDTEAPAVLEKQPAIGQLQLKELLSGTSMKIVEYAQKLAEAPLIGTVHDEPLPPSAIIQGPTLTAVPSAAPLAPATGEPVDKKSTIIQLLPTEDRYPGPDHDEPTPRVSARPSNINTVIVQEDETADIERYEVYTMPEGSDKGEDVPSIIKKYLQAFQDDRQPIAKVFKLEDEEKLNEAAGWDIQPSFRSKPECIIRCSVLKKILRGLLEFRLAKSPLEFDGRQPKMIMQVLSEDVATTLSQLRFLSYKYGYFVTLIQKNRQDVIVSTRQLWDPETDRRVIARYENRQLHASIIVHFIFHP